MYATLLYFMVEQYEFENPYLIHNLANDFKLRKNYVKNGLNKSKGTIYTKIYLLLSQIKCIIKLRYPLIHKGYARTPL
jgi:hypothetical protein